MTRQNNILRERWLAAKATGEKMTNMPYPGTDAEKWDEVVNNLEATVPQFRLQIWRVTPSAESYASRVITRNGAEGEGVEWSDLLEWIKANYSRGDDEVYGAKLKLMNGTFKGQFRIELGADELRKIAYQKRVALAKAEYAAVVSGKAAEAQQPQQQPQQPMMGMGAPMAQPQPVVVTSNDPAVRQLEQRFSRLETSFEKLFTLLGVDSKIEERINSLGQAQPAAKEEKAPVREEPKPVVVHEYVPPQGMLALKKHDGSYQLIPEDIFNRPPSQQIIDHAKAGAAAATPAKKDEDSELGVIEVLARAEKTKTKLKNALGIADDDEPAQAALATTDPAFDPGVAKVGDSNFFRKEDGTLKDGVLDWAKANPDKAAAMFGSALEKVGDQVVKVMGKQLESQEKMAKIAREKIEIRALEAKAQREEADRDLRRAQIAETNARTEALRAEAARNQAEASRAAAGMNGHAHPEAASPAPETPRQEAETPVASQQDGSGVVNEASMYD